jgi:hypothetical protein
MISKHTFSISNEEIDFLRLISNNSRIRHKHPGFPDSSDASDRTSLLLMGNYTLSVKRAIGRDTYSAPLLGAQNVVTYTHDQNDTWVALFASATVMQ